MNYKFQAAIMYLIRDMRIEYSSINTYLSNMEDDSINAIKIYVNAIMKQISLLDRDILNPNQFSNDIRIIKDYTKSINKCIKKLNKDKYYPIYIYALNGMVYCDEIASTYVNNINDDTLANLNVSNVTNKSVIAKI